MNSSGIKRGLASSAIAALAVAGLPLLAGSANAAEAGFYNGANDVDLITGESSIIWDTAFDGANNNIHLVATGGSNVSEVLFEFQKAGDPTWTTIARVSRSAGQVFTTNWVPTGFTLGDNVSVRATGFAANNATLNQDVDTNQIQGGAQTVDIGNAAGSSVGLFQQPYAGNLLLGALHGTRNGINPPTFIPQGFGAISVEDVTGTPDGLGIRTWSAPLNATGYAFGGSNTFAVEAATAGGFDSDAEGLVAYQATISGATISASPTSIPTPPGGNSTITLKVTDQNGNPVVGAQIASNDAGAPDPGNDEGTGNTGTDIQGYTNSQGELKLTRPANSGPAANYRYWVNTTANVDYQAGTDFLLTTHVGTYTPVITTVAISSADGDAFDIDENAANDIRARILDQNGNPVAGATPVKYTWSVDPFDDSPVWTASGTAANSDAQGYSPIPFPAPGGDPEGVYSLVVYVDNNGTPGLQANDPQGAKTLKAGQANTEWTAGDRTQVAAGTKSTLTGTLKLDDGTVLAGRFVTVTRQSLGTEETGSPDAFISVQADQPAGTNTISPTEASAKTDADGKFSVSITDPAENPQGKELNDVFRAEFGPTGGTFTQDDITVDFLRSLTPASIDFVGQSNLINGDATPGRPVSVFFEVRNAQGDLLTDSPVTVAVDHGFITPFAASEGALTPATTPANGDEYGLWKNNGTSDNTLQTADAPAGQVRATVAIERDPGFDDDGMVDTNVTVTAGGVSSTEVVTFHTDYDNYGGNPLNQGDVTLSLQDNAFQDSQILPDARVDQAVGYNVEATDSFGNLMQDEVVVSDDTAAAQVDGSNTTSTVQSQFTDEEAAGNAAFFATSVNPGTVQTVTSTLTNDSTKWVDNPATVAIDIAKTVGNDDQVSTDTADAINWYAVDFADPATQLVFTNDEAGEVPVGTPVHSEVEIIDQKGQPVDDMDVTFVRRGPNTQNGDFNNFSVTDANGIATYDWVGTSAGTADVSAFVYNTYGPGTVSDGALVKKLTSAKIIFKGDNPPQQAISPKLSGRNNLKGDDILTVSAKKAVGATVKLFKVVNGKRVLVNQKSIKANGTVSFKVADKNGNKKTTYVAKVKPTTTTLGATTNQLGLK